MSNHIRNNYERDYEVFYEKGLDTRKIPRWERWVSIGLTFLTIFCIMAVIVVYVQTSERNDQSRQLSVLNGAEQLDYRLQEQRFARQPIQAPPSSPQPANRQQDAAGKKKDKASEPIEPAVNVNPVTYQDGDPEAKPEPVYYVGNESPVQKLTQPTLADPKENGQTTASTDTTDTTGTKDTENTKEDAGEDDQIKAKLHNEENSFSGSMPLTHAQNKTFEPSWKKAYVQVDLANLREDASLDAEVLTQVIKGDTVTEIETNGDWSLVQLQDGLKGYVYSSLLSYEYVEPNEEEPEMIYSAEKLEEEQTPCNLTLYSNASVVRIRTAPTVNSEIITEMYYGNYVHAVSYGYDWYKIELKNGKFGYVHGKYLQLEPIETEDLLGNESHQEEVLENMAEQGYKPVNPATTKTVPSTGAAGARGIVDLAMQYVGYPYVYGAAGPNAFDCSGFVQFLHAQMGVSLGRTTNDQVYNGIDVPFAPDDWSHMVPGDLILLAQGSSIYHVMIYIGNGQVVHAGTPATGVNIDNLAYYANHMAYVKRIFY